MLAKLDVMTMDNSEFVNIVKREIFNQYIYVYTIRRDIVELPSGSTPIDFAYKIHIDVGNTIMGQLSMKCQLL